MKKLLLVAAILATVSLAGCSVANISSLFKISKNLSQDEAKAKAEKFINENLVQPGSNVTVTGIKEDKGLYEVTVKFSNGQTIESYLSKDGSKFYPQSYDTSPAPTNSNANTNTNANAQANNSAQPTAPVTKSDKPKVELFVMAYCPYGTQIEKGILPVVNALKGKIDFAVKFVDYSMHGKQEVDENLRQWCIETGQSDKYLSYLKCFLAAGDSSSCLKSTSIDQTSLNSCVSKTDAKYNITANYNDKSTWLSGQYPPFDINKDDNTKYGVQGSPTLVINGSQAESGRDASSLQKTICGAFNSQPDGCKASLSTTPPSTGFGFDASGPNSAASCGN